MKKTWLITLAVVALAALGIGIAVPAFAHNANVTTPATSSSAGYADGPAVARVAAALNLTTSDLLTKLQSGETLAQIAAEQGVSTDAVVDALVAPYGDALTDRVTAGTLTQEQADQLLQTARDNATSFLTQDLSGQGAFSNWYQEMEQYCEQYGYGPGGMMNGWNGGNSNGSGYGYGPGMMEGWNGGNGTGSGYGFGPGACMGGWNDGDATPNTGTAPQNGTGNRYGGGFGGGMMSW